MPISIFLFAELVDIKQEIERLEKESKRLDGEVARVNGMLSNERFLSKAPESKIAEEKRKIVKIYTNETTSCRTSCTITVNNVTIDIGG